MKFSLNSKKINVEQDASEIAEGFVNGTINTLAVIAVGGFITSMIAPGLFQGATTAVATVTEPLQEAIAERKTSGSEDKNFESAMAFIYHWEGGLADNPADRGGRTFKGVTAAVAQRNGVSDPANLTDEQINRIYRNEFWDAANCGQYQNPLATVCLDTAVNFGLRGNGETSQGWRSLTQGLNLNDDPVAISLEIIERRIAWRHKFGVGDQAQFVEGWLNRDRALQSEVEKYQ